MTILCCDSFKQLTHEINWFRYTDEDGVIIMLMPCFIGSDNNKYRINHCPTCGTDVRQLKLTETEFWDLTTNETL
jgi:hypothetical protein